MTNINEQATPDDNGGDWFRSLVLASASRLEKAPESSQTAWYKEHQADKVRSSDNRG